jgi:hypothetical protein
MTWTLRWGRVSHRRWYRWVGQGTTGKMSRTGRILGKHARCVHYGKPFAPGLAMTAGARYGPDTKFAELCHVYRHPVVQSGCPMPDG